MTNRKTLKIITVSLIVFVVLLATALVINLVKLSRLNARRAALSARIADIEREIEETGSEIDRVTSDSYIDQYARDRLNMQGKDEEAFTGRK